MSRKIRRMNIVYKFPDKKLAHRTKYKNNIVGFKNITSTSCHMILRLCIISVTFGADCPTYIPVRDYFRAIENPIEL